MRHTIHLVLSLLALQSTFAWASGNEPFKPGKLPPAEVAALQPGLTLRFYAKDDAKSIDARRVRLAALHVPKDTPPSPFVPAGPFHAKLSGYLKNQLKGSYTFRLTGSGAMSLRINGKEVLTKAGETAEVELAKNYNRIEVFYASPENGDATLRLDWSGEKFGYEPVPPDVLFSRKDDADLVTQTQLREGRQLFVDRNCMHCHGIGAEVPELKRPWDDATPRLDEIGYRFQYDWLVKWILDPRSIRPDASMPKVLAGPDAEKDAADMAAHLMTFKNYNEPKPLNQNPMVNEGAALFKKLGCSACHRMNEPTAKDDLDRISLNHVNAKYAANALAHFLKKPDHRYPWTRMPDFHVTDDEAGHLEAYLRDEAKGKFAATPKGDPKRGAMLISKAACYDCHSTARPGIRTLNRIITKLAVPMKNLAKGCLAEKHGGKAPDFQLTHGQWEALTSLLKTDKKSLTRETPAEFATRQVKALRCDSCHRRDGELTRWHTVVEDDGKEPEKLPSLTWTGEKLKPAWTKKLLKGETDHRARPWLKARMPGFPARADMLAVGLSHEHGFGIDEDDRPKHDPKLAAIGEKLIPQQGGFNCINCHGIGTKKALEPFEAPGINLLDAALRLRYSYYQRWMLAPDRVDVIMRMPMFATDGKTTQLRDVFDGDARRQYDALWHYIQTLPGHP